MTAPAVCAWLASPPGRGGVAIIDLATTDPAALDRTLDAIGPGPTIPSSRFAHRTLPGIDDGVIARIDAHHAQVMPHGGPVIVRRLILALEKSGVEWLETAPADARPESEDAIEALALDVLCTARSPAAIEPLLEQARRWRGRSGPLDAEERRRSRRLDRLVEPVTVACIGGPNAGKSSLLNALVREPASIVSELAGTTRDRVSRRIDLAGVVVDWIDTPGLRETDDAIERTAIRSSLDAIRNAVLVVHLIAPDAPDPGLPDDLHPDEGVLRVRTKSDLPAPTPIRSDHVVGAIDDRGVTELASLIRHRIVRAEDFDFQGRWAFAPGLDQMDS